MTFQPGAILVENGTTLPSAVALQTSELSESWRSVAGLDRNSLDAQLEAAGWTFFYMAGVINRHAFGFNEDKRVRAAVGRVIEDVQSERCNSLEITGLTTRSFFGVPYVSVTAHARHIQDGNQFRGR